MYLDESGDYKDEEGKAIDVVIDKDLTEGESIGGTVSGSVKYRWGPKSGSGKEESDYILMPDSQAVKQTNMA